MGSRPAEHTESAIRRLHAQTVGKPTTLCNARGNERTALAWSYSNAWFRQFLMTLDSSVMNVAIATVAKDVGTRASAHAGRSGLCVAG